jgi:hypothetical protein
MGGVCHADPAGIARRLLDTNRCARSVGISQRLRQTYLNIAGCMVRSWSIEPVTTSASSRILDSKRIVHNGFMVDPLHAYLYDIIGLNFSL